MKDERELKALADKVAALAKPGADKTAAFDIAVALVDFAHGLLEDRDRLGQGLREGMRGSLSPARAAYLKRLVMEYETVERLFKGVLDGGKVEHSRHASPCPDAHITAVIEYEDGSTVRIRQGDPDNPAINELAKELAEQEVASITIERESVEAPVASTQTKPHGSLRTRGFVQPMHLMQWLDHDEATASGALDTGRYIRAHRGTAIVDHYLSPKDEWHPSAKIGWQQEVAWGPTHICRLPDIMTFAEAKEFVGTVEEACEGRSQVSWPAGTVVQFATPGDPKAQLAEMPGGLAWVKPCEAGSTPAGRVGGDGSISTNGEGKAAPDGDPITVGIDHGGRDYSAAVVMQGGRVLSAAVWEEEPELLSFLGTDEGGKYGTAIIGTGKRTEQYVRRDAPIPGARRSKFNINHNVRVQLTKEGKLALEAYHRRFWTCVRPGMPVPEYTLPTEDENGWSTWQLWSLMEQIGSAMSLGGPLLFGTEIELLDTKDAGRL